MLVPALEGRSVVVGEAAVDIVAVVVVVVVVWEEGRGGGTGLSLKQISSCLRFVGEGIRVR